MNDLLALFLTFLKVLDYNLQYKNHKQLHSVFPESYTINILVLF